MARRLVAAALAVVALACADPAPARSPTEAPSRPAPTGVPDRGGGPAVADLGAAPEERAAPVAAAAPVVDEPMIAVDHSRVPPVTRGPTLRLRSTLESGEREAGGRSIPTIAHPDGRARASLDAHLEALPEHCRVELALERLVSLACARPDANGITPVDGVLLAIAEDGSVARLEPLSLFHAGADRDVLLRRLQHDPAGESIPFVVTETGIELRFDDDSVARFPWRAVAPLLRPDTVIGEALAAETIPLAPAGVPFPSEPPSTTGLWAERASHVLHTWWHLPDMARATARLVHPGGRHAAALVFAPGTAPADARGPRVERREAYFVEPMAEIVIARTTETIELRWQAGDPSPPFARRPAGTIVTAVRGTVDLTDSELGRGHWTFVGAGGNAGWVPGHALELAPPECARLAPSQHAEDVEERGIFASQGAHYAWFGHGGALSGAPRTLAIHALDGCEVGAPVRTPTRVAGILEELHFVPTRPRGGRTLVVMRWMERHANRVVVIDLASEDRVLVTGDDVQELAVRVDRGPGRGYFPVRVRTSSGITWYRWTGSALAAVTP